MIHTSIVVTPLQPGQLRNCPHGGEAISQKHVRTDRNARFGEILVYRCLKCGKEVEYLVKLPFHVV